MVSEGIVRNVPHPFDQGLSCPWIKAQGSQVTFPGLDGEVLVEIVVGFGGGVRDSIDRSEGHVGVDDAPWGGRWAVEARLVGKGQWWTLSWKSGFRTILEEDWSAPCLSVFRVCPLRSMSRRWKERQFRRPSGITEIAGGRGDWHFEGWSWWIGRRSRRGGITVLKPVFFLFTAAGRWTKSFMPTTMPSAITVPSMRTKQSGSCVAWALLTYPRSHLPQTSTVWTCPPCVQRRDLSPALYPRPQRVVGQFDTNIFFIYHAILHRYWNILCSK